MGNVSNFQNYQKFTSTLKWIMLDLRHPVLLLSANTVIYLELLKFNPFYTKCPTDASLTVFHYTCKQYTHIYTHIHTHTNI